MTVLALKASRAANGVSELHGQVSREMWQVLFPGKTVEEVPIGHITNGIHLLGWMKGPVRRFWRRKLAEPETSIARHAAKYRILGSASRTHRGKQKSIPRNSGNGWPIRISSPTRKSGRCATTCAAS